MSDTFLPVESTPASVASEATAVPAAPSRDRIVAERPAPDPTRYGDWEKNGRCIDF
ncbi:MAG TPA: DUF1674 domain-containing protein [Rhodanobacter sp.]|nr:DUF1674 domain-containing protein [Rhodanobacter sp.]